jgi:hypothetical protein
VPRIGTVASVRWDAKWSWEELRYDSVTMIGARQLRRFKMNIS